MPNVVPTIIPCMDQQGFIKDVGAIVTRPIEAYKGKLTPFAKWLATLESFKNPASISAATLLQESVLALPHFSYTLRLIDSEELILKIIQSTELYTLHDCNMLLLTGTLRDWKYAIVEGSRDEIIREVFNECYYVFEKLGLSALWHDYQKRTMKKGFLLDFK